MLKHLLEVIGDAFIMLFGGMSLLFLIDIFQHGIARYCEPNMVILIGEMTFASLVIIFGGYHLIVDLGEFAKGGK